MNHRMLVLLTLLLSALAWGDDAVSDAVGRTIDDFHDAAAHADKARYLGHLTEDAVFMGTRAALKVMTPAVGRSPAD